VIAGADVFSTDDLHELSARVATAWRAGADRDSSAPAGTLEWSCARTADHAVDTLFAPAFFLASRRQHHVRAALLPDVGIG
jgi:hypothetical protein